MWISEERSAPVDIMESRRYRFQAGRDEYQIYIRKARLARRMSSGVDRGVEDHKLLPRTAGQIIEEANQFGSAVRR